MPREDIELRPGLGLLSILDEEAEGRVGRGADVPVLVVRVRSEET